ncbi:MAG TPA: hypothetical protein VLX59_02395 [Acidimicrobiales bacterium]|nr:hypothetical protein [Acidimicrobiales bacterium]
MLTATVLAANANQSAAALVIDLIVTVIMFVAPDPNHRHPAPAVGHGLLSNTAWIVATIWFTPYVGWLLLPVRCPRRHLENPRPPTRRRS